MESLHFEGPGASRGRFLELPERLFGPPGSSLGHIDRFKDALGVLWGRPGDAPGALQDVPGSFSAPFWKAQGLPRLPFWSCLDSNSWFISRNGEMLENDDPLNENVIFWTS